MKIGTKIVGHAKVFIFLGNNHWVVFYNSGRMKLFLREDYAEMDGWTKLGYKIDKILSIDEVQELKMRIL
jgi:hypothetical protein